MAPFGDILDAAVDGEITRNTFAQVVRCSHSLIMEVIRALTMDGRMAYMSAAYTGGIDVKVFILKRH